MIFRRLASPIFFIALTTLLSLEYVGLHAQPTKTQLAQNLHPQTIVAKNTKKNKHSSTPVLVKNIRYHDHKKYTRIVFDLPTRAILKKSKKNNLAIIELAKSQLSKRAFRKIQSRTFPKSIAIKEDSKGTVVITLSLRNLKKYELQTLRHPDRVVIDLFYSKKILLATLKRKTTPARPLKKSEKKKNALKPPIFAKATKPPATAVSMNKRIKDLVVVIDPGHGGRDPGAMGKKGTKEKHITLKIGTYLRNLIQKRLGSKVLLTRDKDVFLNLEKRVEFANKNKADLFISIHVNSHPQKSIKGLEVYHFGKASDPRALEVAARENGMKLENGAPPWQFIIADKLNDQKIEQSQTLAWTTNKALLKTLKASYKVKDHGVKTAPFYVLRFTTMPSILAEVAFLSNPEEEKRLRSKAFQQQLAEGIYKSIRSYLKTDFSALS
ncbi:MAG: N-acetylmuramoyl-L-alanine amidase [Nitrospirota bacterium]|nr:N-acetylmuramoyl-L-alanine amidase [Nitrospirota bacterium]